MVKNFYLVLLLISLLLNFFLLGNIGTNVKKATDNDIYFYTIENEAIQNLSALQNINGSNIKYKFMGTISGFLLGIHNFDHTKVQSSIICRNWNQQVKKNIIKSFTQEKSIDVRKQLSDILMGINTLDDICIKR